MEEQVELLGVQKDDIFYSASDDDLDVYSSSSNATDDATVRKNKLGTLMGVFLPAMLGAYGVVVYERLAWIVGQAGLLQVLAMFGIGYVVVILTVISMSAMATNGKMKGGGAYYIISRALGPEFGGSIGLLFFCANVFASSFYIMGFQEAWEVIFEGLMPHSRWWAFLYGSIVLLLLTFISIVGAGLYAKTSAIFLIVLFGGLLNGVISILARSPTPEEGHVGVNWDTFKDNLSSGYVDGYSFAKIFGIVFPPLTGLISGSNMSGDLKDPSSSIPKGTFIAVLCTAISYSGLSIMYAATCIRATPESGIGLLGNYYILMTLSWQGRVIWGLGVLAAVLSSALNAIIGGARIMQALAKDQLLPFIGFFAKGNGPADEPRRAVILVWFLTQMLVFVGDLNVIAPYVTIFYMWIFCFTNLACFLLSVSGAPNFRPMYKYFTWHTALAGVLSSGIVIFVVDPVSAAISMAVMIILFFYIHYRSPNNNWGDITQALIFHQVRKYLLQLDIRKENLKYWRAQFLLFTANPRANFKLISFINEMKHGGLYILGTIIKGDPIEEHSIQQHKIYHRIFVEFIARSALKAFVQIVVSPSVLQGAMQVLMTSGLGGMYPNTIVLGFHGDHHVSDADFNLFASEKKSSYTKSVKAVVSLFSPPEANKQPSMTLEEYLDLVRTVIKWDKSLIITRHFEKLDMSVPKGGKKYIDVWLLEEGWQKGMNVSATLTWQLMLAQLLYSLPSYSRKMQLRVLAFTEAQAKVDDVTFTLDEMLGLYRIRAVSKVFALQDTPLSSYRKCRSDKDSYDSFSNQEKMEVVHDLIEQASHSTAVAFLPLVLPPPDTKGGSEWISLLQTLTTGLPPIMLVYGTHTVLTTEL